MNAMTLKIKSKKIKNQNYVRIIYGKKLKKIILDNTYLLNMCNIFLYLHNMILI